MNEFVLVHMILKFSSSVITSMWTLFRHRWMHHLIVRLAISHSLVSVRHHIVRVIRLIRGGLVSGLSKGWPPLDVIFNFTELFAPELTHVLVLGGYHRLRLPVPEATTAEPWLYVVLERTFSPILLKFDYRLIGVLDLSSCAELPVGDCAVSTQRRAEMVESLLTRSRWCCSYRAFQCRIRRLFGTARVSSAFRRCLNECRKWERNHTYRS